METTSQFKALDERYFMPAFSRDMAIVKGEGSTVWDAEGKQYLDCVAGIAVCSTGHCHPAVVKAICDQAHQSDPLFQPLLRTAPGRSGTETCRDYRYAQGLLLQLGSRSN